MKKLYIILSLTIACQLLFSLNIYAEQSNNAIAVDYLVSQGIQPSYRINIKNDDKISHKYNLTVKDQQKEFKGTFLIDKSVVTDVVINPGDSIITTLQITFSEMLTSTKFVNVEVKRDDGNIYSLPLSITPNKDYSIKITSQLNGLNVINGQMLDFDVTVSNTGNKELSNIILKSELPSKWIIKDIYPDKLLLKPGESGSFKIKIDVPSTQVSGNSILKIWAINDDISSSKIEMLIGVQDNPKVIYWVIGLVIIIGISTVVYFRKHGRR